MTLRVGEILDEKYRIVRQIGEGGMGAVFLGENTRVKKMVAIKVLHANAGGVTDAVQRFEREAQAAGQIGSDHIVEVYDLGSTSTGDRFMVMEYLEGESLRHRVQRGQPVDASVVVPIMAQLLEGLAAAHAAGIVHRDLKPDNVFILREKAGRRDFVKILDFGISKFMHIGTDGAVTRTGVVMGSPNYMSPEQVKSSTEVDGRSDLYTVGVILFEAATGQVPFKANTFAELLFKIVYEPLPDPRNLNPSIDDAFAELIVKACACDRNARFQTAGEFKAALLAYADTRDRRSTLKQDFKVEPGPRSRVPPLPPPAVPSARPAPGAHDDDASDSAQTLAIELPPGAPGGPPASPTSADASVSAVYPYPLIDEPSSSGPRPPAAPNEQSGRDFGSLPMFGVDDSGSRPGRAVATVGEPRAGIGPASNGATVAMHPGDASSPQLGSQQFALHNLQGAPGSSGFANAPPASFNAPPSSFDVASAGNGTGGRFSSTLQPSVQSPVGFERPRRGLFVALLGLGMFVIAAATAGGLLYFKGTTSTTTSSPTSNARTSVSTEASSGAAKVASTSRGEGPSVPAVPSEVPSAVPSSVDAKASAAPVDSVTPSAGSAKPIVRGPGTGRPNKPGSDVLGY